MTTTIAIDPGYGNKTFGCACAMVVDASLVRAWFERSLIHEGVLNQIRKGLRVDAIVWEKPLHRERDEAFKGIPVSTLIELASAGSGLAREFAALSGAVVKSVYPHEWKGSSRKPSHHGRLWASLTSGERALLGGDDTLDRINAAKRAGALDRWARPGAHYYGTWQGHNLLDAAGIGKYEAKGITT